MKHPSKPLVLRSLRVAWLMGLVCLSVQGEKAQSTAHATNSTNSTHNVSTNSLGMKFVRIPSGEFMMGSQESVASLQKDFPHLALKRLDELSDEMPLHRVKITRAFDLGQTEVTRAQFEAFLKLSAYVPESIRDQTGGYGYSTHHDRNRPERADAFAGRDPAYSWKNPGFAQADDHPVVNITWNDAMAMAKWLTQKEGVTYRLPTEAEWEYACKAGTATRYPHGDDPQTLTQWANVFDASARPHWQRWHDNALPGNDGHAFSSPVASYPPNAFGLYDMVGNVWEWVSDHYAENYYSTSPEADPQGPPSGPLKVRRGGSWHTWPIYARCSYRNINATDSRYTLLGMRLLREVAP